MQQPQIQPEDEHEEAIAYFRNDKDFIAAQAKYNALIAAHKHEHGEEDYVEETLEELLSKLDNGHFDIASGVTRFLQEIGATLADKEQNIGTSYQSTSRDVAVTSYENTSIAAEDAALLFSVLATERRDTSSRSAFGHADDNVKQRKARILDTVARLALNPALTFCVARTFKPILLDIAFRWLNIIGHTGREYGLDARTIQTSVLLDAINAFARLLPVCEPLYPLFLLLLQHPYLQTATPFDLLTSDYQPVDFPTSSARLASASPTHYIRHPQLVPFLLVWNAVLSAVPDFPSMPSVLANYGGPTPPSELHDIMSSHPLVGVRILAWRVVCAWLRLDGPKKAEMWETFVYNAAEDPSNGRGGSPLQTVPEPDLSKPEGQGEEWIGYWPRPSGRSHREAGKSVIIVECYQTTMDAYVFEEKLSLQQRKAMKSTRRSEKLISIEEELSESLPFTMEDLCAGLADIHGIHLLQESILPESSSILALRPAKSSTQLLPSSFVHTSPAISTLRHLALHVSSRMPALLSSPPSAGKAALLDELHRMLHARHENTKQIVTINLADRSLDAKTLLGSLSSSPQEPGTFVFVEGSLTRAIRHGRWLVLEDIDKAADDVLSTVAELVERIRNRSQRVIGGGWGGAGKDAVGVNAGGQWVEAAEGFMLFATRSVPLTSSDADAFSRRPLFFGSEYWSMVWAEMPSLDDTKQIVAGTYPRLHPHVASRLVDVWDAVRQVANSPAGSSGTGMAREIGIRDLMRWCNRIQARLPKDIEITAVDSNPVFQEEIFVEARDVFLGAFPYAHSSEYRLSSRYLGIVSALSGGLMLSSERAEWAMNGRTPELILSVESSSEPGNLQIGRTALPVLPRKSANAGNRKPYALTKPFLTLLERLAVCAQLSEPVLMVGETGTGKTAAVGHLADRLGRNLVALNLSNQTEASDLLGGFKPVNAAEETERLALTLVNEFVDLFSQSFSLSRNAEYNAAVQKAYQKKKWLRLVGLFREAARMASDRIAMLEAQAATGQMDASPRKKRKTVIQGRRSNWQAFLAKVNSLEERQSEKEAKAAKFAFSFIEGPLVKAIERGDWVLLDEVNLATPETLESLSTLLHDSASSLVLTERGDLEAVRRHPDFRLFACMNPATDVGKRDLPSALRGRFTEIYVPPPDADREALVSIVQGYIGHAAVGDRSIVLDVAEFYLAIKALSATGKLADGSNQPPHFSMRTLARTLTFASEQAPSFGIRRAVYEGCVMTFTTLLEADSARSVFDLLQHHLVAKAKNPRSFLSAQPLKPSSTDYIGIGSFWLPRGPLPIPDGNDYVLTASVQSKLINLARSVAAGRSPVLIQGPTSSGKTSIIEFLARKTGHRFVRINNHEHTDIQEYLGTYVSDPQTGKLVFREGILVNAVRNGDWIVLDELNLAPTDVLEALNRLLDDNRELVLPETQEVIKPHPHFMLFATQNPPGLYGGRKVLSRAFRNRFLEMHFSDVPKAELETILCERCQIAPSYAKKIVAVFLELQRRRQSTRVFEEKQAFVTLRDLFRWGGRGAVGYEQLSADGYMLLAERARKPEDKRIVKEVIESIMKVKLDEDSLYASAFERYVQTSTSGDLVWTRAMRRLYVLVRAALEHDEPVLLVGETGSGKTSVCQSIADALASGLHIVNCHQNTETSDLLGSQRPIRNRSTHQQTLLEEARRLLLASGALTLTDSADYDEVCTALSGLAANEAAAADLSKRMQSASALFAWHDGPLVQAMKNGDLILLDEISLADDSVLERLNSVLESSRTLVIAEKGAENLDDVTLVAHPKFKVLATMNPGGDYGKKELSPALRNRFTEIWVPWVSDRQDLQDIINGRWSKDSVASMSSYSGKMLDFAMYFTRALRPREEPCFGAAVTLRDILAWVAFINAYPGEAGEAFVHGAVMTIIDAIGSTSATSTLSQRAVLELRGQCLSQLLIATGKEDKLEYYASPASVFATNDHALTIAPFSISRGHSSAAYGKDTTEQFSLLAPTTLENARKVLRAMQVTKPILLEGSPGVGKTSLVTALADLAAVKLCRINLSDQTDLIDLFGSDLPVEGGRSGEFAWKDAPFLTAMQNGDWVLLDEMNLASQSVLEGLNSCLDHRGSVFIPELDRSFTRHADFRIFAAQNPSNQGGARKGLPRSFVDRFTQVFMNELTHADYATICKALFPQFDPDLTSKMVTYASELNKRATASGRFGSQGGPWEINLRDLLRWFKMLQTQTGLERLPNDPSEFVDVLFVQRFRNPKDQAEARSLYTQIFGSTSLVHIPRPGHPLTTSTFARIGRTLVKKHDTPRLIPSVPLSRLSNSQLHVLESLATILQANYLAILTGEEGTGKSTMVQTYAAVSGQRVQSFFMNSATDTLEMLGSFEQSSVVRTRLDIIDQMAGVCHRQISSSIDSSVWQDSHNILAHLRNLRRGLSRTTTTNKMNSPDELAPAAAAHKLHASLSAHLSYPELSLLSASLVETFDEFRSAGRFEWINGVLVNAMTSGDILVIENANMCNASVLDRLNALFEPNGQLTLTERGTVGGKTVNVTRHPDFRVVMTVDPKYGELSRAMRNRGVEIAVHVDPQPLGGPAFAVLRKTVHQQASHRLGRGLSSHNTSDAGSNTFSADIAQDVSNDVTVFAEAQALRTIAQSASSSLNAEARLYGSSSLSAPFRTILHHMMLVNILAGKRAEVSGHPYLAALQPLLTRLDTNNARRAYARAETGLTSRIADDAALTFFSSIYAWNRTLQALPAALTKPARDLLALEQSYLTVVAPGRISHMGVGISALHPLLESLHTTIALLAGILGTVDRSLTGHICEAMSVLESITFHISSLSWHKELNYGTFQTLLTWLVDSLKRLDASVPGVGSLYNLAMTAKASMTLTSGQSLDALWHHFLPKCGPLVRRIHGIANGVDISRCPSVLREIYLEMSAELRARPASEQDKDAFIAALESLEAKLTQYVGETEALPRSHLITAVAELKQVEALARSPSEKQPDLLLPVADIVGGRPLGALSTWSAMGSSSAQAILQWIIELCFTRSATMEVATEHLLQPSLLGACLSDIQFGGDAPLVAYVQDRTTLRKETAANLFLSRNADGSRIEQMAWALLATMREMACAIDSIELSSATTLKESLLTYSAAFAAVPNLRALFGESLLTALQDLGIAHGNGTNMMESLASTYVSLGTAFWSAFVANVPVDPAMAFNAEHDHTRIQKERATASAVVSFHEEATPGQSAATDLELLHQKVRHLDDQLSKLQTVDVAREASSESLAALYRELHQCGSALLSSERIRGLMAADGNQQMQFSQLDNLQQALTSVAHRLQRLYPQYQDIVRPVLLSLGSFCLGLTLRVQSMRQSAPVSSLYSKAIKDLTTYPTIAASEAVLKLHLPVSFKPERPSVVSAAASSINRLRAAIYLAHAGVQLQPECWYSIKQAYDQLHQLWILDQQREAEAKAEAESIYRSRESVHEDLPDTEREEAELAELFPSFDDLDGEPETQKISNTNRSLVGLDDMRTILQLHQTLFEGSQIQNDDALNRAFLLARRLTVTSIERAHANALPEHLDSSSAAWRLDLLSSVLSDELSPQQPNFYTGQNTLETIKIVPLLQSLIERLEALIETWPEQMVLHELRDRCASVSRMSSKSPVAKVLTALEQLLPKLEDWEGYASRDTSLRKYQNDIAELVVLWRRLELSSWANLLNTQQQEFQQPVSEWWFRFYDSIIKNALAFASDSQSEGMNAYLASLVELLGGFFNTSPIGQFHSRLQLVGSFANLAKHLSELDDDGEHLVYKRLVPVLRNVYSFYAQRNDEIATHLSQERKKIEKEVQDTIRLASWKDINIYALRQSAQKSHRQLYKSVRKLRALLEQPAGNFLIATLSSVSTPKKASEERKIIGAVDLLSPSKPLPASTVQAMPAALQDMAKTAQQLRKVLNSISRSQQYLGAEAASKLADTIIERSQSLRDQQPKGESKEQKAKSLAGLTNQKRKAWSELLKEVKRIGLSSRPSGAVVAQLHDIAYLYGSEPLANEPAEIAQAAQADCDAYFYRIAATLAAVRNTPTEHHDDVSSSQLQLAIGSIQTAFHLGLEDRSRVGSALHDIHQLDLLVRGLTMFGDNGTDKLSQQQEHFTVSSLSWLLRNLSYGRTAIEETITSLQAHSRLSLKETNDEDHTDLIIDLQELHTVVCRQVRCLRAITQLTGTARLLRHADVQDIQDAQTAWTHIKDTIVKLSLRHSHHAYLLRPLSNWLESKSALSDDVHLPMPEDRSTEAVPNALSAYTKLVSSILVVVQENRLDQPGGIDLDGDFEDRGYLRVVREMQQKLATFRLQTILEDTQRFAADVRNLVVVTADTDLASSMIQNAIPALQAYSSLLHLHMPQHLRWHRSQLKLIQILCNTVLTLAKDGYCKPTEADGQTGDASGNAEGTGIGTGQGEKNISDEIEDDSQVEGLQGEQEEEENEPDGDDSGKDDKYDMSEDFGGRTEDVEEEDGSKDEEDDEDDDDEGKEDPQDEMGDVDPLDPSAVDDKFWQGEDGDESPEEPEEKTSQKPQQNGEAEMGARDDKEQKEQPKSEDGNADEEGPEQVDEQDGQAPPDADVQDNEPDSVDNDRPEEESKPADMPDIDEEAQALDLPDDLELDAPPSKTQEDDSEEDFEMEGEQEGANAESDGSGDEADDLNEEEVKHTQGEPEPTGPEEPQDQEMQHTSGQDVGASGGQDAASSLLAEMTEQTEAQDRKEDTTGGQSTEAPDEGGQTSSHSATNAGVRQERQEASAAQMPSQPQPVSATDADAAVQPELAKPDTTSEEQDDGGEATSDKQAERDLGDATKAWVKRLQAIPDAADSEQRESKGPEGGDIEYTHDAPMEEAQAAGPASEEQAQKAGQKPDENAIVEDFQAMEVDDQTGPSQLDPQRHTIPDNNATDESGDVAEGAQADTAQKERDTDDLPDDLESKATGELESSDEQDVVGRQLQHWFEDGRSSLPSDEVWRLYESLTRDLSFSLTEALRLILEPTLATRLKGDYRTGKRLNMKKIIPYIASDFTKDKIWLRRTRPSQREYQILLTLDDSESMSKSHSVHLAYQTLALVSQALNRLEVGEVSVARFGESVDFVHNFEDGALTGAAGAKIVDAFTFAQRKTDVRKLLQESLLRLASAKENRRGSAADLWQMQIIISDGMCQDLEDLRALLRKAAEQKVMVVFVIVDSLHQQPSASSNATSASKISIMSMKTVSQVFKPDGTMDMQVERYMDNFPFDYYVVLRNVESLPDVLSETLRQFFERVAGDR